MDATKPAEDRIMTPVLRRLSTSTTQSRRTVVRAHATQTGVPGLDRLAARMIADMRASMRSAVARTPGLTQGDVAAAFEWRAAKIKALVKVIKQSDRPALGMLVALAEQPAKFGADLTAKVSDTLVARHTTEQDRKCGPGEVLIWQPERDACVRCQRYAGQFRARGEKFTDGLTFDPDATEPKGKLTGPPLHPNCRCELEIIPRAAADDNSKALRREAERSILKGWALPSESNAARVRAAQELLNSNVIAPKSVISETRKRLKSGEPFIRDVP